MNVTDYGTESTTVTLSVSIDSLAEGARATTVVVTGTLNDSVRLTDTAVSVSIGASTDSATRGTDYANVTDFTLTITGKFEERHADLYTCADGR